nr:uncharacterized protein LOC121503185 [Drosophila kikkawai]
MAYKQQGGLSSPVIVFTKTWLKLEFLSSEVFSACSQYTGKIRRGGELQEQYEVYQRVGEKPFKPNNEKWTPNNRMPREFNHRKNHCFNCGSADHLRKDCKAAVKCFSCNKKGHMSRDCPG